MPDRLADVLAGEVSRPRHGDQISITFDSEWMGPVATAIRAALRDGTLTPEDLGIRGGIPTDCNCGFGGQHDSENPRCTANRLPAPSREDGA